MFNRILLYLLLLLPVCASAQWLPAHLTLSNGSVLDGRVRYFDFKSTVKKVVFMDASKKKQEFPVAAIQQLDLTFPDDARLVFKTFAVQYDTSAQRLHYLDLQTQGKWKQDIILMKQEYDGTFDLFRFMDRDQRMHLFIQFKDSTPVELLNKLYSRNDISDSYFTNDAYKQQITNLLADCPEVANQTFKLQYRSEQVIEYLRRYDACRGVGNSKTFRMKKAKPAFSALVGLEYSKPNTKRVGYAPAYITIQPAWSAGGRAEFFFPQRRRVWSYQAELIYHRFQAAYETRLGYTYKYKEQGNFVRFNNIIKIGSSDLHKYRLSYEIGASLSKTKNRSITVEKYNVDGSYLYNQDIFIKKASIEMGVILGACYQKGRLGVGPRFEYIVGQLFDANYSDLYPPRVFAAHLMVSYQLTKPVLWR